MVQTIHNYSVSVGENCVFCFDSQDRWGVMLARPPLYRLIDGFTLGVSQFRNNIARKDLHLLGFIEDGV
jgi:hypothetical protein